MEKKLCIGLTGRMSSGKGEAIKILKESNYRYISLSDIVRDEVAKTGQEVTRSQMQDIGNRIRKSNGPGILGKQIREKIKTSDYKKWVIDGIRNPAEIDELKKIENFFLLGLNSEIDTIMDRIKKRNRKTDIAETEELKKRLDREWGIGEPQHGQHVGKCMELADFVVDNNGSLEELELKIYNILKLIGEKNG